MPELQAKDAKLIQYLNEAHAKEKDLETALQAHIGMTTRKPYKRRLQDHLKETKAQARALERRIKQLGGKAESPAVPDRAPDLVAEAATTVASAASKAVSAAKGPLHALRGTGEAEKMLKNAKTEYWNEHEEIATYKAIETLAESVGDRDTQRLAREHRRQEERMANFLARQIPPLTRAVAQEEIPASERNGGRRRRRRSSGGRSQSSSKSGSKSGSKGSPSSRSRSSSGARSSSSRSRSSSRRRSGSSSRGRSRSGRSS